VNGRLVTATNGNSIFLPAAGYWHDTYHPDAGSIGIYWSSSPDTDEKGRAWIVEFNYLGYGRYTERLEGWAVIL